MNEFARTDLETLADLRSTLLVYASAAAQVTRTAEHAAAAVVDRAAQAVSERFAAQQAAQAAYDACTRQPDADCSGPAQQVQRTQERLKQARQAFATATQAIAGHTPARQRYSREVERLVAEGSGTLAKHALRVGDYLGRSTASGGSGGSAGGAAAASVGGASGPAEIPGAPAGFAMVPLSMIDNSDSTVTGPESFEKGYTPEDLAWAHSTLHETVLPAMKAGKGPGYFQDRDADANRFGSRSLADTYGGFFGDSCIKLEPADPATGKHKIGNGYHRVWVAQQMGLSHVAARLP